MTLQRIHKDGQHWFSVYRSEATGVHVLVAVRRGNSYEEIAMRLRDDEITMLREAPEDMVMLARNFIYAEDWPGFKPRKISFRQVDPETIEIEG